MCRRDSVTGVADDGAIAVMVAVLLTVFLLAFAAVAVDAGAYHSERRQMQTGADAAALAGVQDLPHNPASAIASAEAYAILNAPSADDLDFTIGSTFIANDTITAELVNPDMGLSFARFLGRETTRVDARAVAVIGSPTTYGSGLMPFGIIASGTVDPPYGYNPGEMIVLVEETGKQSQGNWHYVDLTDYTDGSNNTKSVISGGGTTDPLSIGDIIYTQTGSPSNPNYQALVGYFDCAPHGTERLVYDEERGIYEPTHNDDGTHCYRLITCPVIVVVGDDPYNWDSVTGKSAVEIVGFLNMLVMNDPTHKDGALHAQFVQVVPADTLNPGGYVDYAGVVYWLAK